MLPPIGIGIVGGLFGLLAIAWALGPGILPWAHVPSLPDLGQVLEQVGDEARAFVEGVVEGIRLGLGMLALLVIAVVLAVVLLVHTMPLVALLVVSIVIRIRERG
jgi:hypothetical protein